LKIIGIVSVFTAIGCLVFLGFYQCGGYIWVRQSVFCTAVLSYLIALFAVHRISKGKVSRTIGVAIGLSALLILAWYSGQALYITPLSIMEFFGTGC